MTPDVSRTGAAIPPILACDKIGRRGSGEAR